MAITENSFPKQLKAYRTSCVTPGKGILTQFKLAEKLGYSDKTISLWENGDRKIPLGGRETQLALIREFYEFGVLSNADEANQFLALGGYHLLTAEEIETNWPEMSSLQQTRKSVPPHKLVEEEIFTAVWCTRKTYTPFTLWRDYDIGTLFVRAAEVEYQGEKISCVIRNVTNVSHVRQSGDLNPNWVKVEYIEDGKAQFIYFGSGKKLGVGNLLGGSEEIFISLRKLG